MNVMQRIPGVDEGVAIPSIFFYKNKSLFVNEVFDIVTPKDKHPEI